MSTERIAHTGRPTVTLNVLDRFRDWLAMLPKESSDP